MTKTMLLVCSFLLLMAVAATAMSCRMRQEAGLGGKDVRLDLDWIAGSGGDYTRRAGDYGRKLGKTRFYELHVPAKYDPSHPAPAVFVFHGGGSYPAAIRYESGMDAVSDREGFIVVYPAGTNEERGLTDRLLLWNDGRPNQDGKQSTVDDLGFFDSVLADVQKHFKIDPKRVYACGFSNGAQFTYCLAKQRSDRIAAIAAVAGQRPTDGFYPPPPRPISVMQFSGKEDTVGPYEGGVPKFKRVLKQAELKTELEPVRETIASWAQHDGCSGDPKVKKKGKATEERWGPCEAGTEVILWTLEDGGHTWPGGKMMPASVKIGLGNINQDIQASDLMWDFFTRHPLP